MTVGRGFNSGAEELISGAAALRPLLERNAPEVERERRLTEENLAALEEAGLFGAVIPERWGGAAASLSTMVQISIELAKGCASTSWVHTTYALGSWLATLLPDEGQEAVFGNGSVPRSCAVATAPGAGVAHRVDGGYLLTGRWAFASGSLHADWGSVLMTPVLGDNGEPVDFISGFFPMSEVPV